MIVTFLTRLICRPNDEGMLNGTSIFAYLVFGPGGITAEGMTKPVR
jgi:hypothetical protein